MKIDLIFVAALIVVVRTIYELIDSSSKRKRVKLEAYAVLTEFQDEATKSERRRDLLVRNPGLLIPLPAGRYFAEAERLIKENKSPRIPT